MAWSEADRQRCATTAGKGAWQGDYRARQRTMSRFFYRTGERLVELEI